MEESVPKSIGNYEAVERLRQVPEGVLYKAIDSTSKKPVLIKIYYPSLNWSEEALDEFFNRISYLRFIEHEYLLPISDVGKHGDLPYVVFPGDSDTSLDSHAAQINTTSELFDFFSRIAEALDFLHKQEILHGNLNTDNILIGSDGSPQLFDYGLSVIFKKLLLENLEDGFDNLSVSNADFSTPEQILGRTPTRQTDIYSFGLVFYYCLFGDSLFKGPTTPEIAAAQLDQKIIRAPKPKDRVSSGVINFIQKCIQIEPGNRFKNFSEIGYILDRLKKGKGVQFPFKKRFTSGTLMRWPRRMGLYLGVLLLLGCSIIWYRLYGPTPTTQLPTPSATAASIQIPISTSTPPATTNAGALPTATHESVATQIAPTQPNSVSPANKPAFEGEKPTFSNQAIKVANLQNIREVARLGYGKPEDADISPDGKYFAVASSAGVFIFSGNQFLKWIDPQDWATGIKFSSSGAVLAIGVQSGDIQLWDWQKENKTATLSGHKGRITRLIFSNNDRLLYSASYDQHVRIWDLNQQTSIKDIAAHSTRVNDIAVTSDGRILISCSDDQLIRIWDIASKSKMYEMRFEGKVKALAISPDDVYFAAGGETGFIKQWRLVDYQLRNNPIPVGERIWNLQYEDDNTLLAGIDGGEARTFAAGQQSNLGYARFEINLPPSKLIDVYGASFDFDTYAVSFAGAVISLNWDGQVKGGSIEVLKPTYDNLDRLDFSKDGTVLASGGKRGTTNVWRLTTNNPVLKESYILPFGDPIAPDGSAMVVMTTETITLAGGSIVKDIYHLLDLSSRQIVRDFSEAVANSNVGYARAGSVFISESLTHSKTWDYASGYETYFSGFPQRGCWFTKSTNDGETLSVNSVVGILPKWETWSETICAKSLQYRQALSALAYNSSFMAYINSDGALEGFDPVKNQMMWKSKVAGKATALAISPDGAIVALGNDKGRLIFINSKNGENIIEISGNFGAVQAIEFSEDGTKVATAGYDGTTRVFGVIEAK